MSTEPTEETMVPINLTPPRIEEPAKEARGRIQEMNDTTKPPALFNPVKFWSLVDLGLTPEQRADKLRQFASLQEKRGNPVALEHIPASPDTGVEAGWYVSPDHVTGGVGVHQNGPFPTQEAAENYMLGGACVCPLGRTVETGKAFHRHHKLFHHWDVDLDRYTNTTTNSRLDIVQLRDSQFAVCQVDSRQATTEDASATILAERDVKVSPEGVFRDLELARKFAADIENDRPCRLTDIDSRFTGWEGPQPLERDMSVARIKLKNATIPTPRLDDPAYPAPDYPGM